MRKLSRKFRAPSLKSRAAIFLFPFFLASPSRPDTIILHDGASYAGQFSVAEREIVLNALGVAWATNSQ